MKIAYLVLAHDSPRHLERLVGALSSSSSALFIHIDKKSRLARFPHFSGDGIVVSRERIPVYWADFSIVEATLILLRQALADPRRFDYFVLLSGCDYPLQPASYIERFFESNRGAEFINIVEMPCEAARKPIARLLNYRPYPGIPSAIRLGRRLLVAAGLIPRTRDYRPHFGGLLPFGGSQWWALSRDACEYVRSFVDSQPRLAEFYRNTFCPDESFFHTILGNSPFRAHMRRNVTYADWSAGGPHPARLNCSHIERFADAPAVVLDDVYGSGEALFARKFSDMEQSVVARLDELLISKGAA